jgi:hypothetical protein
MLCFGAEQLENPMPGGGGVELQRNTHFPLVEELFIMTCELFFEKMLLNMYCTFSDF